MPHSIASRHHHQLTSVRPNLDRDFFMADDKWTQRKPGRVSGTVVPPPAAEDAPPLPERRIPGRSKHRPEAAHNAGTGTPAASPELPDNVRPLFNPVLRQRELWSAGDGSRDLNQRSREARSPQIIDPSSPPDPPSSLKGARARSAGHSSLTARGMASAVMERVPVDDGKQPSDDAKRSDDAFRTDRTKSRAPGHPRTLVW